ncbi:DUF488 domain-containing protein [Actinoallomurus bryophytorum]|uniref:Uncharacterized protein DUF488 n=1 Tax=Actinoallomurus bryophytorum TaxID=1490222 RepID=A0A543CFL9_9ACTN|nr:DUF488 domain-containing protein [Actinoallomurus bryophytorum]TQL95895.1 uncharacterized protein DUF488 [Actinoallomurus bryophytorum]
MGPVRTFGHGTASEEEIVGLLRDGGVELVVDVRTAPGSRRNPHVSRASLENWLPSRGFAYRWDKRLGGFRRPQPDSPDVFWRQEMFRGYAAHMRTSSFAEAIDELLAFAGEQTVMCSESVWWRCHRRMIADFLVLVRKLPVEHLMHDGRPVRHEPTPGARLRDDGLLVYDAGQEPLL